jgi:hypothetical protein
MLIKLLLWCILLVFCWPLALLALIALPLIWIVLLPFRLAYILVEGTVSLIRAIILLPSRLLGGARGI